MPYAGPYVPYYPPVYPTPVVPWIPGPYVYPTTAPAGPQIVTNDVYIGDPPPGMTTTTWSASHTLSTN
jgi:hypothetical protein